MAVRAPRRYRSAAAAVRAAGHGARGFDAAERAGRQRTGSAGGARRRFRAEPDRRRMGGAMPGAVPGAMPGVGGGAAGGLGGGVAGLFSGSPGSGMSGGITPGAGGGAAGPV